MLPTGRPSPNRLSLCFLDPIISTLSLWSVFDDDRSRRAEYPLTRFVLRILCRIALVVFHGTFMACSEVIHSRDYLAVVCGMCLLLACMIVERST